MLALALDHDASRRLAELGLLIGAIGGLVLILGGLPLVRRLVVPLGGLLIAAGLVLLLLVVRYGVNPFGSGR